MSMDTQACLDNFREGAAAFFPYLDLNRNLSAHTLRAYQKDIQEFLDWVESFLAPHLAEPESRLPEEALREMPSRFVMHLNSRGLYRTTLARKASALKTFFKFLIKERYFTEPLLQLKFHSPKVPKRLPDFLSVDEVSQLVLAAHQQPEISRKEVSRYRDQAIVELLFSSGIRVGELVGLDFEHIHWEQAELVVLGKGNRERISFMSQAAVDALRQYQAVWSHWVEGQTPEGSQPVFINYNGTRITTRSVHRLLLSLAQRAGLSKKMHPHIFRHTFATHLLNNGVDLRMVQELLGHVSIRSTQIYTHVTTERLRKAYMNAHPRAMG